MNYILCHLTQFRLLGVFKLSISVAEMFRKRLNFIQLNLRSEIYSFYLIRAKYSPCPFKFSHVVS